MEQINLLKLMDFYTMCHVTFQLAVCWWTWINTMVSFAVQNVYKLAKTDELQLEAISECFHIKRPIQLGQGEMHKCSPSKVGHINGIKGPSILMFCLKYDPVQNVSIDIMHLLFWGIVRMLMKLRFNGWHSLHSVSLYRYIDINVEWLLNI